MINFVLYILKTNLLVAVCIGLVYLLSKVWRKRYSTQWKYYTWMAFGFILLIPFSAIQPQPIVSIEIPYQQSIKPINTVDADTHAQQENGLSTLANQEKTTGNERKQNPSKLTLYDYANLFVYAWIGGIFILGLFSAINYHVSVRFLKRWALSCRSEEHLFLYDEVCHKRGIKRYPRLMISSKLTSPILSGLVKPTLYVPDLKYTDDELKLIYHHELSHYQNKDLWYKLFLLIINTVYWFNPTLYFMRREADKDLEYICDSGIMRICSTLERKVYHNLILKTAAQHNFTHYISVGLNDDMRSFKERVLYMIREKKLKKGRTLTVLAVVVLVTANLLMGCVGKTTNNNKTVSPEKEIEKVTDDSKEAKQEVKQETDKKVPEGVVQENKIKTSPVVSEEAKQEKPKETTEEVKTSEKVKNKETPVESNDDQVDKSGDYMGSIAAPIQPLDDTYRIHSGYVSDDHGTALVLHVTNLDNANIKFHLTEAFVTSVYEEDLSVRTFSERVIFKEHIAHYNGEGYYEYIGKDYHLYFKYDVGNDTDYSDYNISAYGFGNVIDQSKYDDTVYYNGISGIQLYRGGPFAG